MTQSLLDTHTLIWYLNGSDELSEKAKAAIETENTVNFVSIVSLWEIAIKIGLGKLHLNTSFSYIQRQIDENGFEILPVTFRDTMLVSTLEFHHKDPFDRMLIAQSITNKLVIVSKDKNFELYENISLHW